MTRIKICCIQNTEEAQMAIEAGAHAVGLVSAMPNGPGPISDLKIRKIIESLPPGIASFLLTSRQSADEIVEQLRYCKSNTVQIVDELLEGSYQSIREALPGIKIVQVVHVQGDASIGYAQSVEQAGADAILLDSGRPGEAVKILGGTGNLHDWGVSRRIVQSVRIPVFLAGGLNPDNVADAIRKVRPFGVDVCSGLRVAGKLDSARLDAFIQAVNQTS